MNNFLKGKLSYASSSKPKRARNIEHQSVLQSKENDCIYESILSGMGGGEKEYISDLIKCKRRKEGRSSHTRNIDDDSAEENISRATKQSVLRMNSPKLKHVQSLDEAEFLDEQPASAKYKSTNTSFVFTEKLLDKKERQNSQRNLKVEKSERDNFIGSLDGYIHKLESVEVSKIRESSDFKKDFQKDYEKKYKHLAEAYTEQVSSSKQKEEKLVSYIKNLKKYVKELEEKVMENEEKQKSFGILWKRREEQFGILMGIEREINEHIYGESEMDEPSTLDYEEEDSNIRHTLKFNPKEIRRKSRHTVNYH